ncbi:MAG: phosphotransferase family protein [Nocardioides sp.]
MREPPPGVDDSDVLEAIRGRWGGTASTAEHVPVGFGAHHWRAGDLFVTLDTFRSRHTATSLEAAYAGAAALHAAGLEFVHPSLPTTDGSFTVPLGGGALSCTPWRDGTSGGDLDLDWTSEVLRRLHVVPPPVDLPEWRPLVDRNFAEQTTELSGRGWGPGPYADRARDAVRDHLVDIATWTSRYHHLAEVAEGHEWVATHGEPHAANQLATREGRLLIDWESLKLAPPELDLRTLVDAGLDPVDVGADPEMLELFDLEWRLDEISQYAAWFAAPHTGTQDDRIAFGGLLHELERDA